MQFSVIFHVFDGSTYCGTSKILTHLFIIIPSKGFTHCTLCFCFHLYENVLLCMPVACWIEMITCGAHLPKMWCTTRRGLMIPQVIVNLFNQKIVLIAWPDGISHRLIYTVLTSWPLSEIQFWHARCLGMSCRAEVAADTGYSSELYPTDASDYEKNFEYKAQ